MGLLSISATAKLSGNAEKDAQVLYQRLAGVPLRKENPLYNSLVGLVRDGKLAEAAQAITHPTTGAVSFYEVTVRNIASTYNRYESSLQDRLNDFMALFIGVVRDSDGINVKNDDILLANYLYNDPTVTTPAANVYNASNNGHFDFISKRATGFARQLVKFTPTDFAHVGAFDTRAMGLEYSTGGTLRRPYEAVIQRFFVVSQKSVMQRNLPSDLYRRDFPVALAGMPIESSMEPNCIGCHRSMDASTRVFLDRHFSPTLSKIVITPGTAVDFDQVNEVNRPEQVATNTVGKIYVSAEMNEKVFGYKNLINRGGFLEADLGNMRDFMGYVANARGYHRGFAKRIAFYAYTGRLLVLADVDELDGDILKQLAPVIEELTDSLEQHRNLRRTFEEAVVRWIKL